MANNIPCVCLYLIVYDISLSTYPSMDTSYFYSLAFVNNAVMNMEVQIVISF